MEYFLTQDNQLKAVGPSGLGLAKDSGWKPVGTDIDKAKAARDAGSFGGMVKTGLESAATGAVDALTAPAQLAVAGAGALGVDTGHLGRDLSGRGFAENLAFVGRDIAGGVTDESRDAGKQAMQAYAEAARRRAETNSTTAMLSSMAGQIAAGGGIARAGGLAASGAKAAFGTGLGGRLATQAARYGAEGALLGGAQAQDQAYLEDRELTGQQVIASAGLTGLLGLGLGAATKGLSEVFGAVGSKFAGNAAERAEQAATGKAPVKDESAIRSLLGTTDEKLSKQVGETIGEQVTSPKTAEYVREGLRGGDLKAVREAAHEEATSSLTKATNEALDTTRTLARKVDDKAWKLDQVAARESTFADDALDLTREKAASIRADVQAAIDGAGKDAPGVLKGLAKRLDVLEPAISTGESAPKAYVAMDQIRRDLHATARAFELSARAANDVDKKSLYDAIGKQLGGHYDDTANFLMDHSTWGEQGIAQKEVNTARAALIKAEKYAMPGFASKVDETYEGLGRTRDVFEAHDGNILSTVKKLGTTEGAFAERRLRQYLTATEQFATATEKYGLSAEDAAAVKAVKANTVNFEKALSEATEKVGAINQASTFLEKAHGGSGSVGGGVLGHVLGGTVGAAAGAVIGAAANPAKFMAQKIALEQSAEKFGTLVTKSLDKFFAGSTEMATKATGVGRSAAGLSREGVPAALAAFQGRWKTPEEAYRRRFEQLSAANDNHAQSVRTAVADHLGDATTQDPQLTSSAVVTATNAVQFLQSKFGTPAFNFNSLTPISDKPTPSRAEIMQTARYWAAVDKPMSVFDDLQRGKVTREQVEALKAVYPKLYDWMRQETVRRIRAKDQAGETLPLSQRMTLDVLLDLNGAGIGALGQDFADRHAQSIAQGTQEQQAAQAPRPGPSHISKRFETGTTSMLGGT